MIDDNLKTEEKIRIAARGEFLEKGFNATRIRDIAELAEVNVALVNYYFRSKENLFDIIMFDCMQDMFSFLNKIVNNEQTSLSFKIQEIVKSYVNMYKTNPHLPLFVFREIQTNPDRLIRKIGIPQDSMQNSYFFKQLGDHISKKKLGITPLHVFVNIVSLTILPVVGKSFIFKMCTFENEEYENFVNEREALVPEWIKAMLDLDE
ncbi:AcrR family transcriptional regulator [Dysgonomonas sp. PH5-45]|uniref:TetR/AcrR family transcriptional regulator n=1 Tax=unclassified Dysgonomonas TaxID=2630389 RepID=UPI0024757324|nr:MULTISPECIES: TetR/AcrR family transcriptional regulator [unclassified Dysgonomonas]MDH6353734.1 AcrR family transcriptional regulator [Dysgonomonas sp. PH5-45]MDH6386637.1 AcrR family transcriptional regulator [Dysgonomonas sp. PH5-37]